MYHYTSSGKCPSLPQISVVGSNNSRIPLPPPRNPPPAPPTQRQLSYGRDSGRFHHPPVKSKLMVSFSGLSNRKQYDRQCGPAGQAVGWMDLLASETLSGVQ